MDPIIGGSLISAGASLLGGIFGKSKPKFVTPDYAKIRRKAEAAGFNPLTALTSAPGQVVQSQNYMGSAIADAGLLLADGMAKKAEQEGEVSRLKEQNQKLAEKVQNLTLRPRIGGIYAVTESTPSLRQALGVQGASGGSSAADRYFLRNGTGLADGDAAAGADRGPGDPSAVDYPRHVRVAGIDWYGDRDYDSGNQIENVLGDSMATEPIMAASAMDMVADTVRLQASQNAKLGPYDQKRLLGFGWRTLTPNERRDSPAFQLGPIKIGRGDAVAKNERVRQRLRERLKRGEKLTASEMIAAGH